MSLPLNPHRLTPSASLNRVRIVELPGVELEPDVRGKTAYELLSAQALMEELLRRRDQLGLAVGSPERHDVHVAFERCFESSESRVRAGAEEVAWMFGRRLAYLVATLKRGDLVNRLARAEWDASYWERWSLVRQIWLGGGQVSGTFGRRVLLAARQRLGEIQGAACDLRVAPYPRFLPLIGAARTAAPTGPATLVFDFGQSYIKRGWAAWAAGALQRLHLLPPLEMSWSELGQGNRDQVDLARELAEKLSRVMGDSWRECLGYGVRLAPQLVASVASYVEDGHPLPGQGGPYARMRALPEKLAAWLARRVASEVGHAVDVVLLHDGTAAARALPVEDYSAVIMVGTALGVGFPPQEDLRPLAADFTVE